ncbi:MAG: Iron-containing alcohol dehydrogenase [Paenibacillus sp.]|jgi:alcohol dehydrogenase class IV|nr:Iron-containing alcohol dehydrogenase [Paenibacillus sp.]
MSIHPFIIPEKTVYGNGSLAEVGRISSGLGRRALIVCDPTVAKLGFLGDCERYLDELSISCSRYAGVATEPTTFHVKEALEIAKRSACDLIIAIGGGSAIDTAKAVAVLATNDGELSEYAAGKRRFSQRPLPFIAIPTTAGTGSEVTKVTVITDPVSEVKMMIADPLLTPAVALIDPLLTHSCPAAVTAATGIDALCHAIEAYLSRKAHPMTDLYALKAIDLIAQYLPLAYADGRQTEARERVAFGSMLAGAAFSNASVTLVHGMSRPIGAMFHVPHGVSNAMLLPAVLEFTQRECPERLARIGRILSEDIDSPEGTIAWVKRLCRDLKIVNMRQWGIERGELERRAAKMAQDALNSGSPANTPRIPTQVDIVELYRKAYDYEF